MTETNGRLAFVPLEEEGLGPIAVTRGDGTALPEAGARLAIDAAGEQLRFGALPEGTRYLRIELYVDGDNSQAFDLVASPADDGQLHTGEAGIYVRFGLLPRVASAAIIDLDWLDAHVLFPGNLPGQLKYVVHGRRIARDAVRWLGLSVAPGHETRSLVVGRVSAHRNRPPSPAMAGEPIIDGLGQLMTRDWPGRTRDEDELRSRLNALNAREARSFGEGLSRYGGALERRVEAGTGRFRTARLGDGWQLLDPDGAPFFSLGLDCVRVGSDCRIDGVEAWLSWLPDASDPLYGDCFGERLLAHGAEETDRGPARSFSYMGANLRRVFGEDWEAAWHRITRDQLIEAGLNTVANWSDPRFARAARLPWVTQLPAFPSTERLIFRDFPDVFDPAFAEDAARCAEALRETADDDCLIGYFLRNEPNWAFVDGLNLADEVLRTEAPSFAKTELIASLREQYGDVAALNRAWQLELVDFEALATGLPDASQRSAAAEADQRRFSRRLIERYVAIPSEACRRVDPTHLNLGMRWAWISDPDLISGWEHCDVFSINSYAMDPRQAIRQVRELGVDRPVMIGEFHVGALDVGLTATGLRAVRTQAERGLALRAYIELAASEPGCVGCHYFQAYDQFPLGRFDGENYNIGLIDVCFRPYEAVTDELRRAAARVMAIHAGEVEPIAAPLEREIPRIAF